MTRVLIMSTPPGEAPIEIREAWVGLELPVAIPDLRAPLSIAVVGIRTNFYNLRSRLASLLRLPMPAQEIWKGYPVEIIQAIWILEQNDRTKAALWWCKETPHLLRPGQTIIFPASCCRLIDENTA